ncbi:MAG: hypothetical protein HXY36_04685 [Chloroflexi bacterium]|nr:hypothetical protein [Chloroflexota bacterium]
MQNTTLCLQAYITRTYYQVSLSSSLNCVELSSRWRKSHEHLSPVDINAPLHSVEPRWIRRLRYIGNTHAMVSSVTDLLQGVTKKASQLLLRCQSEKAHCPDLSG